MAEIKFNKENTKGKYDSAFEFIDTEIKKDDKIVATDGIHLLSAKGEKYDLGFARKVKILYKNISRAKFADAKLTSRMKIRQTNVNINDLKSSIEKCIENYERYGRKFCL